MSYAYVLDDLIKSSGMSVKEIAERCKAKGTPLTSSYISILRNPSNHRTPSMSISTVLQDVLGVKDNALVMEAYIDDMPEEIRLAIDNLQKRITYTLLMATHNPALFENKKQLEVMVHERISKSPRYLIIQELAKQVDSEEYSDLPITMTTATNGKQQTVNISSLQVFPVKDNAMYPVLPKGSNVQLDTPAEYRNGDIVAFLQSGNNDFQYRQWNSPAPDIAYLMAFNSEFQPIVFDSAIHTIMGKVVSVTTNI